MATTEREQKASSPRHRKRRSLRPEGRHRATLGFAARWIVPVGLAVAILSGVAVILVAVDAFV